MNNWMLKIINTKLFTALVLMNTQQVCIPVGCVLPARWPSVFCGCNPPCCSMPYGIVGRLCCSMDAPHPCGQTGTCESITFPQLRLRAVNVQECLPALCHTASDFVFICITWVCMHVYTLTEISAGPVIIILNQVSSSQNTEYGKN